MTTVQAVPPKVQTVNTQTTSVTTQTTAQSGPTQNTPEQPKKAEIDQFVAAHKNVPDAEKPMLSELLSQLSEGIVSQANDAKITVKQFINEILAAKEKLVKSLEETIKSPEKLKTFVDKQIALAKEALQQHKKQMPEEVYNLAAKNIDELAKAPNKIVHKLKETLEAPNVEQQWLKHWLGLLDNPERKK